MGILEMRKHYNNYFKGIRNAKTYRSKLVRSDSYEEIMEIVSDLRRQVEEASTARLTINEAA